MAYRVTVDTGGTFTDVVVSDEAGQLTVGKSLTTRERIFVGMKNAIAAAAEELGQTTGGLLDQTEMLIYGTTRATNAVVTKTVAKTCFLTTKGFPDTLVLREGGKFNPHDYSQEFPKPYIPRRYTFEIEERISSEGTVSVPFNETQARQVLSAVAARGFEAVAVSFLWSIVNADHELIMGELIEEMLPGVPYTLSHQLTPVVREYRRASATAIDASLKPLMQSHLRELESDLRSEGYGGEILVSTAAGGCNHVDALIKKPIYTVGSGPAMAPIAGITFSAAEKLGENIIICDTGGTTFDVGLVIDGKMSFKRDTWLGGLWQGDLLGISAVDMRSIGAGGGSIAWVDAGGLMKVGPQSAGADPGPACYGRGGSEPTVSDAAVVLGYFDPDFFLGGRMSLDVDAARAVIAKMAGRIGASVEETAWKIVGLASDLMVRAIGDITINEGFNPRDSAIVAGGGAAGLNILMIAKELGCHKVILPKVASALSASGMQYADIVVEEAASFVTSSDRFDIAGVNRTLEELTARVEAFRMGLGDRASSYRIEYTTDARYPAQVWELETPMTSGKIAGEADLAALVETFHQVHERVFAVRDAESPVEMVNWNARLVVDLASPPPVPPERQNGSATPTPSGQRDCYFGDAAPVATPIFKAQDLHAGETVSGPAIIEEPTTTLVVYPGMSAQVSPAGHYLLDPH